eukprot:TRINITY_DN135_c0_g1_i4.p1 TRINITY_DN135_c0_g1~~TRINITY_DN135_c0_g1_i4.p1  ORF type:complete len:209 (-),score=5.83 TRINITY_DN135_c0_g1_i4:56-682(-)
MQLLLLISFISLTLSQFTVYRLYENAQCTGTPRITTGLILDTCQPLACTRTDSTPPNYYQVTCEADPTPFYKSQFYTATYTDDSCSDASVDTFLAAPLAADLAQVCGVDYVTVAPIGNSCRVTVWDSGSCNGEQLANAAFANNECTSSVFEGFYSINYCQPISGATTGIATTGIATTGVATTGGDASSEAATFSIAIFALFGSFLFAF